MLKSLSRRKNGAQSSPGQRVIGLKCDKACLITVSHDYMGTVMHTHFNITVFI